MTPGEHAAAILVGSDVQLAREQGMGVLLIVSGLTPAVAGGTAVVGSPGVSEAELLRMLSALVDEMRASAKRQQRLARGNH